MRRSTRQKSLALKLRSTTPKRAKKGGAEARIRTADLTVIDVDPKYIRGAGPHCSQKLHGASAPPTQCHRSARGVFYGDVVGDRYGGDHQGDLNEHREQMDHDLYDQQQFWPTGAARCRRVEPQPNRGEYPRYEPVTVVSPPEPEAQPAVEPAVGIYPQAYNPGEIFKDCDECPEMVVVPGGSFLMGSPVDERGRAKSEGPQHQVSIASAFAVGIDEVTFAEWDACVVDGGCGGYRPKDEGWGRDERPAIYVNWNDAKVYVEWLKSETGQKYRLLTESEWEYAARAGTTTAYHWVSRPRFPWTQNWLNRSVQGGPEHDRQF